MKLVAWSLKTVLAAEMVVLMVSIRLPVMLILGMQVDYQHDGFGDDDFGDDNFGDDGFGDDGFGDGGFRGKYAFYFSANA